MCTASWLHAEDGYILLFNRDELRTRSPALAPAVRELRGVRCIAPADGDHGGTWIGANEFGVGLCLLNRCDFDAQQAGTGRAWAYTSRGLLALDLLDARTLAAACDRLASADLGQFRPFTLALFAPGSPVLVARWDGGGALAVATASETPPLLVSSGFDPAGAARARAEAFHSLVRRFDALDAQALRQFHLSHEPSRGPYSPCMHREEATTASFSQITVTASDIAFAYQPGAPCEGALPVTVSLRRATGRGLRAAGCE